MVFIRLTAALILLLILPFFSTQAQSGGISLGQTRIIFSSGDKSQIVNVINSSSRAYLVQSRVQMSPETETGTPFIVTPPLFVLKANNQQLVRILPKDSMLPTARESLFYLSISAIPAQDVPVVEQGRLSMGLRFVLKLFYRPIGLSLPPEEAPCKLIISHNVQGLEIRNPTPYYQTIGAFFSNGHPLSIDRKQSMVAPQSNLILPIKVDNKISWQTITDYGGLSTLCHQSLAAEGT